MDRGDDDRYRDITENLEASLIGLVGGGRLGQTFAQATTNPMRRDRPVVYDVSAIDDSEMDLQAATLLACWSAGFGTVNVANALADAGLEPRHYFVILDELWRALRAGRGMVDRVDALTRLNRQRGVGVAMISHTMSDLLALASEHDRMKAKGFVERSGMVICGGLPAAEMPLLTSAIPLSQAEQNMLIGWQDPPAWGPERRTGSDPPRPRQIPDQSRGPARYPGRGRTHRRRKIDQRHQQAVASTITDHRTGAAMTANNRRPQPGALSTEAIMLWIGIG